ncbi:MAG: hypothetical protein PSX37_04745 [bacterium]|nr:hypothetical protein [bacterium]
MTKHNRSGIRHGIAVDRARTGPSVARTKAEPRNRRPRVARVTTSTIAALAIGGALMVGAPPAEARQAKQSVPIVATPNGTVGISQAITVVAQSLRGQHVVVLLSLNGTSIAQQPINLSPQGGGSVRWTPSAAGQWTVSGLDALARMTPITFTVSPTTTRTVLSSVNQAQVGIPTTMLISVESAAGNYVPAGTVTVGNGGSVIYGEAPLIASGSGLATASLSWAPPSPGEFSLVATYQAATGLGGVPNASSSSSSDSILAVPSAPLVTLRMPSVFVAGDPVQLTAVITNPQLTGSAAFLNTTNGIVTGISPSIPITNNQATANWTPLLVGNQFITANFTATNVNTSGSSTQVIAVEPPGAPDPMSVTGPGLGVLRVNVPVVAGTSQRIPIRTASGSGAAVNLSEGGPCLLAGGTLLTPRTTGTCVLIASSPGGSQFSANTASFVITIR